MGNITGRGTGAATELDAGPDGDSIAAILLSNLSIMVTTKDISELVTWEVGPETSVAGEVIADGFMPSGGDPPDGGPQCPEFLQWDPARKKYRRRKGGVPPPSFG